MTSKPGCREYFKTAETDSEWVTTFADVKCQVLTVEKSMGVQKPSSQSVVSYII